MCSFTENCSFSWQITLIYYQSVTVGMEDFGIFGFFISLGERGRFVTLVQPLEGKVLTLLPKGGGKEASGLASPVVLLDLLDILPHPAAAHHGEAPVMLQTGGCRLWLRRQQSS